MVKVVVLLVGLAMFAVVAGVIWYFAGRFERADARETARAWVWRAGESTGPDGVRVVVERVSSADPGEVLESREVGVADASPEGLERLADLRALARDRARTLNDQAKRA